MHIKKLLKVVIFALFLILAEIFLYFFSFGDSDYFSGQCVMGIDGDSNGNFAVCLKMSNSMNYDIFFFDLNGKLVNKTGVEMRGKIQMKNLDEQLAVQSHTTSKLFDYNGNALSVFSRNERVGNSSYSYECNGITVEYSRDTNGDEMVIYHNGNKTSILDIDYNTYKSSHYRMYEQTFITLNFGLFIGLFLLKKLIKNMCKFEHGKLKDK